MSKIFTAQTLRVWALVVLDKSDYEKSQNTFLKKYSYFLFNMPKPWFYGENRSKFICIIQIL